MSRYDKDQEMQLLERLSRGDEQAFNSLFSMYYRDAYVSAYRILGARHASEDAVQEVFANIWVNSHKLDIRTTFKAYLCKSAVNTAINILKKEQRLVLVDEHLDMLAEAYSALHTAAETEELTLEERQERLLQAIEQLPEKCRLVFKLHRLERYKHKEIADMLQISTSTIENHITKAMHHLQNALNEPYKALLFLIFTFGLSALSACF